MGVKKAMIIDEKIDRFSTNWGVIPTSITLQHNWTTPIDAMSIELAGPEFDRETDFGDGLTGLSNGLGFAATLADAMEAPTSSGSFDIGGAISSFLSDIPNWDWHQWVIGLGATYVLYNIIGSGYRKTKRAITAPFKRSREKSERVRVARRKYEEARGSSGFFG